MILLTHKDIRQSGHVVEVSGCAGQRGLDSGQRNHSFHFTIAFVTDVGSDLSLSSTCKEEHGGWRNWSLSLVTHFDSATELSAGARPAYATTA